MIMTSSSISAMGGMAGGGLVVSSVNKQPPQNTGAFPLQGQQQHPGLPPNNGGPMLSRVSMHIGSGQRMPGTLHSVPPTPRLQGSGGLCGTVQGMPTGNSPYSYQQNPGQVVQVVPIGKLTIAWNKLLLLYALCVG